MEIVSNENEFFVFYIKFDSEKSPNIFIFVVIGVV